MHTNMHESDISNVVGIKAAVKFHITAPADVLEVFLSEGEPVSLPLFSSTVHAGYESPASDHVEEWVNPTDYLVHKKHNCKLFKVKGDCVDKSEIFENDIVVVNTSIEAERGHVVVVETTEGFIIRVLGPHCLMPNSHNPEHKVIKYNDVQEIRLVGVVTGLMKKIPKFML